jgi:hypothetical protein
MLVDAPVPTHQGAWPTDTVCASRYWQADAHTEPLSVKVLLLA